MAQLAAVAPALVFDNAALLRWGYIWRVGTLVRKKKKAVEAAVAAAVEDALDEGAGADADGDGDNDDADAAEGNVVVAEIAEAAAAAAADAVAAIVPGILTAEQAGCPAEVLALFNPARKFAAAFDKKQGMDFGSVFDQAVGKALGEMLGGIDVVKGATTLLPPQPDCVEVGPARIIGGVRPQNFDVAYRPDGVRIAYDSKTLNDISSVRKNWQNMVNDLGTEATTVHTRFPYAIVAFIVAIPKPALAASQQADLIRTLERLATRRHVLDQDHLAEAISLVVWDPVLGVVDETVPPVGSPLRHENLMPAIFASYNDRYKGLPPHD